MKFALLQLNFIVGDIEGNAGKIINAVRPLKNEDVDLCVTSELAISGYPPRDLLLNRFFIEKAYQKLEEIAKTLTGCPPLLIGVAEKNISGRGRPLYNSAVILGQGKIAGRFHKVLLPTYDVFDEDRYFEPSTQPQIFNIKNNKVGITICEDIWNDKDFWKTHRYSFDPIQDLVSKNIDCVVNLSASPFTIGKQKIRESMLASISKKYKIPFLYVNQTGGNDDLIFDGRSCAFNSEGRLIARGKAFLEDIVVVDTKTGEGFVNKDDFTEESELWNALVMGTRDYIFKCGFKKAILGLSGGIDSSVTALIAAEAIGKENVTGILMPSPYSSRGSIDDSLELAKKIGIKTLTIPINNIMISFENSLEKVFQGYPKDITEENIQSRIRGNLLMAVSNKYGAMLLTTGNKSELAVGYCTIYGDMSGGLAVIADVPKTMIYRLTDWLNKTRGDLIPKQIIYKAPSAELRPDQTDQDSLPPYNVLDAILYRHIELYKSEEEIVSDGFDREIVKKVLDLAGKAEFKRKQAPPGLKVTDRAFGTGWRMPIAAKINF
ncbi:MAG: NAD+ synthase [bacterium]